MQKNKPSLRYLLEKQQLYINNTITTSVKLSVLCRKVTRNVPHKVTKQT